MLYQCPSLSWSFHQAVMPGSLLTHNRRCSQPMKNFQYNRATIFPVSLQSFNRVAPKFVRIAVLINRKLPKWPALRMHVTFRWEVRSAEQVGGKLISPLVPGLLRMQGSYTVENDAGARRKGGVLLQMKPDGHNKPIGYWSCVLDVSERPYDTTHR